MFFVVLIYEDLDVQILLSIFISYIVINIYFWSYKFIKTMILIKFILYNVFYFVVNKTRICTDQ